MEYYKFGICGKMAATFLINLLPDIEEGLFKIN